MFQLRFFSFIIKKVLDNLWKNKQRLRFIQAEQETFLFLLNCYKIILSNEYFYKIRKILKLNLILKLVYKIKKIVKIFLCLIIKVYNNFKNFKIRVYNNQNG
jgi:hypothetical protein